MTVPLRRCVPDAEAMEALGRDLAAMLRPGDLVVLTGDLGAGKTTLTRGIGAGLGVRGPVTSPTFVLARVHPSLVSGPALVHVDAYRLTTFAEVDDLDLDASLVDSVTVVEWGQGLVEALSEARLEVRITRRHGDAADDDDADADDADDDADDTRVVEMRGVGHRWQGVALPDQA